jgi:hypothetical protein
VIDTLERMKRVVLLGGATGLLTLAPPRNCPYGYQVPVWGYSRDLSTNSSRIWACVNSSGRVVFSEETPFEPRGKLFNVRAYGGKGDGVTDDTPYIGAAYNAATSTPDEAATLYFPPGNWRTTSPLIVQREKRILIDSGTLSTSGAYGFRFTAGSRGAVLSGRNGQTVLRRADGSSAAGSIIYIDSTSHITVSELELDGSGSQAATSSEHAHGILVRSSGDLLLKNLYLHDNQGDAIDLYGTDVDRIRAENIHVANLGRAGLDFTQLSGVGITVNYFACVVGKRVSTAASLGECIHSEPAGGIVRTAKWDFTNLF